MENKLLNKLINELTDSSESFNQFSKFVRDYEILFKEYDLEDIWFELEIINALALYDWEQSDKYTFWSALWDSSCKRKKEVFPNTSFFCTHWNLFLFLFSWQKS